MYSVRIERKDFLKSINGIAVGKNDNDVHLLQKDTYVKYKMKTIDT